MNFIRFGDHVINIDSITDFIYDKENGTVKILQVNSQDSYDSYSFRMTKKQFNDIVKRLGDVIEL